MKILIGARESYVEGSIEKICDSCKQRVYIVQKSQDLLNDDKSISLLCLECARYVQNLVNALAENKMRNAILKQLSEEKNVKTN